MNKRISLTADISQKRLLSEIEARAYTGLGRTTCRKRCEEWGALMHIGRRILYDRKTIDAHLDELSKDAI